MCFNVSKKKVTRFNLYKFHFYEKNDFFSKILIVNFFVLFLSYFQHYLHTIKKTLIPNYSTLKITI